MGRSHYIKSYLRDSRKYACSDRIPQWQQRFFDTFARELSRRTHGATAGDRYGVTGAFRHAFECLIPRGVLVKTEQPLGRYMTEAKKARCGETLAKKKVDFVLEMDGVGLYFIEYKTNLTFNDLAAAMVEMAAVKRYITSKRYGTIKTASLHLFPYLANVQAMRDLNVTMKRPLDDIWVFCKGESPNFVCSRLTEFRSRVTSIFGAQNA